MFIMNNDSAIHKAITGKVHFGKIVATVGPASESKEGITSLYEAGVDVFRLNFSHGSHEEQGARTKHIRALEKQVERPLGIVADLQGPKLRIGDFSDEGEEVPLTAGDTFTFHLDKIVGTKEGVSLMHPEIFEAAKIGMDIMVDDGRLRFQVEEISENALKTKIITGGIIKRRKGVNIPKVHLPISAVTEKDKEDLLFSLSIGVDWIALSFVQRPEDVRQAKELIKGKAGIIAKIEKPSALENLEEIIAEVDGIMVARGDLGVEIPPEDVPGAQKQMIALCRLAGKPVIVATHMLDSMITSPYPTRAEVSDVANAMYDGADAVMLSAETAAGDDPPRAVTMMRRIVRKTVTSANFFDVVQRLDLGMSLCTEGSPIIDALYEGAGEEKAAAIAIKVTNLDELRRVACYARRRCRFPLFVVTTNKQVVRQAVLLWGIAGVLLSDDNDDPAEKIYKAGFVGREGVIYTG